MTEPQQRPLDLGIIRRLLGYTRPYARLRNTLSADRRAARDPAAVRDLGDGARASAGRSRTATPPGRLLGVAGFLALAAFTELCFVYRSRLALRLGEAVVHDLRDEIYAHLLRMPMSLLRAHARRAA